MWRTEFAAACCTVGAMLLCSGAAKLAVPRHTQRALTELLPALAPAARLAVRALAVIEVATAVGLALPILRRYSLAGVLALGLGFAGAGVLAAVRGARVTCGCFGRDAGRPLGVRTVATGLGFSAVAATGLLADVGASGIDAVAGLILVSGLVVPFTAWLHRDLVKDLIRPREAPADAPGASS